MSDETLIEWCDRTWSPWLGCTMVSPGCANCYAEAYDRRWSKRLGSHWGPGADRRRFSDDHWRIPLRWNREAERSGQRIRVFPSLCDPFDAEASLELRVQFFGLMGATPFLEWILLRKRPNEAKKIVVGRLPNVWLGVSVEDQQRANERIPTLLEIPAKVRFLSVEPMLEQIDLLYPAFNGSGSFSSMEGIHWVIVGGESGPGARRFMSDWADDILRQCRTARIPAFMKQFGSHAACSNVNRWDWPDSVDLIPTGCLEGAAACGLGFRHPKGGDPAEWAEEFRVRQFPSV